MRSNNAPLFLLFVATIAIVPAAFASYGAQGPMAYVLLEGSTLTDDCPICLRPTIIAPLRGTFRLTFREENPLFTTYDVRDVEFHTSGTPSPYKVAGGGTYRIGGEVALVQQMQLKVQINDLYDIQLDSAEGWLQRFWPMIEIEVAQEYDPFQVFTLHIVAAPVREIWYSTLAGFTSGIGKPSGSPGDILSHTGRIVKRNADLVGSLGIMPVVPDQGLDAFDVVPGGEVFFSIEQDVHSETLGHLQHGDLLSDKGRIVKTNQQLTLAFSPMPPASDVGLDAVQVKEDGEILFSTEEEIFSQSLGVTLHRGDLLSDKGIVVRTNQQLLSNFGPVEADKDLGLDAIYVWPSSEIWFSTEVGFQSKTVGAITNGDLLSDNGSVIFRNLELLDAFGPIEDLSNFGLDGLFIVTDARLNPLDVNGTVIGVDQDTGDFGVQWLGDARLIQAERADDPGGPYVPLGGIRPGAGYIDPQATLLRKKSFYRFRLW